MGFMQRNILLFFIVTIIQVANKQASGKTEMNDISLEDANANVLGKIFPKKNLASSLSAEERDEDERCPPTKVYVARNRKCPLPADCEEYMRMGYNASGVYRIWPRNKIMKGKSIEVFCDMDTAGGGWTVIQRRGQYLRPIDYFVRKWDEYKRGFGDIRRDFWLGNDNIFALTNQKENMIRFDLMDVEGNYSFALYDYFHIESEKEKYRLYIQDYSGLANDSMKSHNGWNFTTQDQNNNNVTGYNCANYFGGGWWYHNFCFEANLNGYGYKGKTQYPTGIVWSGWKGYYESLQATEMKIRPTDFRGTYTH